MPKNHPFARIRRCTALPAAALTLPALLLAVPSAWATEAGAHGTGVELEPAVHQMMRELPLWSGLPFVGILLSIALLPLLAPHFWHRHFPKVSAAWALLFAVPFLLIYGDIAVYEIIHIYLIDYIPFIILLWGLFTASGGILLRGTLVGKPIVNLLLILVGTVLASWMGTTGAAMLMIRPLLRANRHRKRRRHVIIFFIFLVANIGGSLTPLGDPPLFLGFLHGVPFFWTMNLLPYLLFAGAILLAAFFVLDTIMFAREAPRPPNQEEKVPLKVEGAHNFLFLLGIMGLVLMSGSLNLGSVDVYRIEIGIQNIIRDIGIVLMGLLSVWTTKRRVRVDNDFSWFPILEVAYLFAGIFMTIIPMLAMLRAGTEGALAFIINAVKEPAHYFWITGSLSSFLDNAPTYLTFFNLALGRLGLSEPQVSSILLGALGGEKAVLFISYLKGISIGAVFFGAMTYIGNAPNFMVRTIAIGDGVRMPSFFGYMLWSLLFLVPTFILVTLVFF